MAEAEDKRIEEALKRAQAPGRPAGLDGPVEAEEVPSQDDDGWTRPERVEHTSEKEHPPGNE
jgi:hypothetical protein